LNGLFSLDGISSSSLGKSDFYSCHNCVLFRQRSVPEGCSRGKVFFSAISFSIVPRGIFASFFIFFFFFSINPYDGNFVRLSFSPIVAAPPFFFGSVYTPSTKASGCDFVFLGFFSPPFFPQSKPPCYGPMGGFLIIPPDDVRRVSFRAQFSQFPFVSLFFLVHPTAFCSVASVLAEPPSPLFHSIRLLSFPPGAPLSPFRSFFPHIGYGALTYGSSLLRALLLISLRRRPPVRVTFHEISHLALRCFFPLFLVLFPGLCKPLGYGRVTCWPWILLFLLSPFSPPLTLFLETPPPFKVASSPFGIQENICFSRPFGLEGVCLPSFSYAPTRPQHPPSCWLVWVSIFPIQHSFFSM